MMSVEDLSGYLKLDCSNDPLTNGLTIGDGTGDEYLELAACNITFVPIGASIASYIAAATAGDTLRLSAGTYTVTAALAVNKLLNIVGQGDGITNVITSTAGITGVFDLSASSRISDLSVSNTAATDTIRCIYGLADGITVTLENIGLSCTGSSAVIQPIYLAKCNSILTNINISGVQATGSASNAFAVYLYVDAATTAKRTHTLTNVKATVIGDSSTYSSALFIYDNGSANGVEANIFGGRGKATNLGAGSSYGVRTIGAGCAVNFYDSVLNGAGYDAVQSTSSVLTLYNSTLVNNTTSGTVTSAGNRRGGGVYIGNAAAPGNRGIVWSGGSQVFEQLSGGGGTNRLILQCLGDRLDTLNGAGSSYLSILNGTGLSLGTGAVATAKLDVKATADDEVLKLTAYSSQTADIMDVLDSTGANKYFKLTGSGVGGRLGVGSNPSNSSAAGDCATFQVAGLSSGDDSSNYGLIDAYRQNASAGYGTGYAISFNNNAGAHKYYAYYNGYIIANTAGAEKGGLSLYTSRSGTLTEAWRTNDLGNIGLGTLADPTAKLDIKATVDDELLKITAHASQTTDIIQVLASDGTTELFVVEPDGDVYAKGNVVGNIALNTQADSYTLVLADAGKLVEINHADAKTLTVPKNSVVAFPTGTMIAIRQKGAGQVTIAPVDGDVTINAPDGLKLTAQYAMAGIMKIDTNVWTTVGSLEA